MRLTALPRDCVCCHAACQVRYCVCCHAACQVRYEDMRLRFEKDMAGFIELKLTHVEAQARLADCEDELQQLRPQR